MLLTLRFTCLEEAHVATVTGEAFGCPNNIRISYAASMERHIEEAVAANSTGIDLVISPEIGSK